MGRVDQKAAFLFLNNHPGMQEFLEMKRQGGRWNLEGFRNLSSWHPLGPGLNQKTKNRQSTRMSQRGE